MPTAPPPASPFRGTGFRLVLFTILSFLISAVAGGLLVGILAEIKDVPVSDPTAVFDTVGERQDLRLILLLNNLFTLGFTGLLALLFTYRSRWAGAAGFFPVHWDRLTKYALTVFLVGLPMIGLVAYLNLQIDLPEWMNANEDKVSTMLEGVLKFEHPAEFALAFLTIAIVPAFAEELLFRGVIQRRILGDFLPGHAAIWIAAAIFSAIHLEFAGFLPRLFLGALLGYAYRWTNTLWVPILLHLAFNGFQVIMAYVSEEYTPDTEMDTEFLPVLLLGLASTAAVIYFGRQAENLRNSGRVG